jgi:hypothetical protein
MHSMCSFQDLCVPLAEGCHLGLKDAVMGEVKLVEETRQPD